MPVGRLLPAITFTVAAILTVPSAATPAQTRAALRSFPRSRLEYGAKLARGSLQRGWRKRGQTRRPFTLAAVWFMVGHSGGHS
jgi:hypothetical protein